MFIKETVHPYYGMQITRTKANKFYFNDFPWSINMQSMIL